jgi:hypothetical protein
MQKRLCFIQNFTGEKKFEHHIPQNFRASRGKSQNFGQGGCIIHPPQNHHPGWISRWTQKFSRSARVGVSSIHPWMMHPGWIILDVTPRLPEPTDNYSCRLSFDKFEKRTFHRRQKRQMLLSRFLFR